MKKLLTILLTILLTTLLIITGCNSDVSNSQPINKTGFYFDTVISITLYDKDKEYLIDECFDICEKYENLFSKTIAYSDISIINSANGNAVSVNKDTTELLSRGLYYSSLTKGYFDITIGALSELWDFSDNNAIPREDDILKCISTVDYSLVTIDNDYVTIKNPYTKIDVGGIAKGYVADKLKNYLLENDVKNGIIDLGGNVLLIGSKPDNSNYNIGIAKPFSKNGDTIAVVRTNDKSIVTSGNYQRYFYDNEILYHHILDPHTGYPVNNSLNSVTIISDKSIDGDALSTSCFALGITDGMKLIESIEGVEAIFVDDKNNITLSDGLNLDDNVITLSY